MSRRQVFEFGDLPWVPKQLKHYLTDVLSIAGAVGEHFGDAYGVEPILDDVVDLIEDSDSPLIVDLCSGAAAPPLALHRRLAQKGIHTKVVLTDLWPNTAAFQAAAALPDCSYHMTSVDATAVPADLAGLRTVFNAFHHFQPHQARQILEDAARSRQGILVVEVPRRTLLGAMSMGLFSVVTLLLTPLIRPFSIWRLLLTYVIPVVPIMVGIDGIMSCVRAYDPEELAQLTEGLDDDYTWKISRHHGWNALLPVTVLLGRPVERTPNQRMPAPTTQLLPTASLSPTQSPA